MRSDEVANYALTQGYQATLRVNGNADLLRLFLSNGIPMIVETWASNDPTNITDGFAHFHLITGYDDARQVWIVYDSYIARNLVNPEGEYQGMYVAYAQTDHLWRVMNRKYVVIYTAAQAPLVQAMLGSNLNDQIMWQGALTQALPTDSIMKQGSDLVVTGVSKDTSTPVIVTPASIQGEWTLVKSSSLQANDQVLGFGHNEN